MYEDMTDKMVKKITDQEKERLVGIFKDREEVITGREKTLLVAKRKILEKNLMDSYRVYLIIEK